MNDSGKYSPLREAHQRIKNEEQLERNAKDMTDPAVERKERDLAKPARIEQPARAAETMAAPERTGAAGARHIAMPEAPGPSKSMHHYAWRRETIARIERERERDAKRQTSAERQQREGTPSDPVGASTKPPVKHQDAGKQPDRNASEPEADVEREE